ncbi:LCP family protein required for cell wall assembly [Microbacteriaceae bacterium SG_E_30_P1]|uniref:LCP family protein required for cell wall assembly n=1 Tax=Antiquaquibacter oligotrophicus TaxID=2880260 RepID=A0ABT6KQR1_9MICO|nr:LCP family protein [Antiquaquibacter oligotrophicus]MDH6182179.1 LCP family protein required for cell wall assembly [Antiquaquibacter oligotrophicus]UDF12159.1 LCP family protein [Antiquaquibacter oligotrophicus]
MSELRPRSELRTATPGIARHGQLKRNRAWPLVLQILGISLAVVLVSTVSVSAVVVNSLTSKIAPTIELTQPTEGPLPQIGAIEGGFNILIVGSDTRAGQNGIGGDETEETGQLNDVNMLLHVSQDQTNAVAISFPRDMVVGIPECTDSDGDTKGYSTEPINVALYYGGLDCVAQTVTELTGLPIQFAGIITFNGVIAMGDAIGGVPVCVTGPINDPYTGLTIDAAGTYDLKGVDALAFLRSRHGVGDGSDLTRIASQQVYLSSLVRKLQGEETLADPKKVYDLASAALTNMQLSSSLGSLDTMVSIALALKDIPPSNVTFVQYPGTTGGSGLYEGKVQPDTYAGDQLMQYIIADQPFALEAEGDNRGSTVDPNAPAPEQPSTPDPTATEEAAPPVEKPVVSGVTGQTADAYTCSIANE